MNIYIAITVPKTKTSEIMIKIKSQRGFSDLLVIFHECNKTMYFNWAPN